MNDHEYSLLGGINRAQIGRYLGVAAATISAIIVFILLAIVDIAKNLNISANLPPSVLSLVGASTVFAILYWLFDRHIWCWPQIRSLLKVPNLSGEWKCVGKTMSSEGGVIQEWSGSVVIIQSWDKIRVRLKTDDSGSNSISAALLFDEIEGYHLLYSYRNDPLPGPKRLASHVGFSNMLFNKEQKSASGNYFNGSGRFTSGIMTWEKVDV